MKTKNHFTDIVRPVIGAVQETELKNALNNAWERNHDAVARIEDFFDSLPNQKLSDEKLSLVFNSWKATHLKMLPIYGLSCRIQRLGMNGNGLDQMKLFKSGTFNAETSYQDLGLDFNGQTHADLYEDMVGGFLPDDTWILKRYTLPEASDFKNWIYRNMVVESVETGLFTNMFSELFNHGEYVIAYEAFSKYMDSYGNYSDEEKKKLLFYIQVHIDYNTEEEHFKSVVSSIENYSQALNQPTDYSAGEVVFGEYLNRVGVVMQRLRESLDN